MPDWKQELSSSERRYNRSARALSTSGWGNLLADLLRDLKYGLRSMTRSPAFSVFAILALALGIGASTTVFTVVNTLLLHPLPAQDPSRLVSLYTTDLKNQKQSSSLLPISYLNLKDYQARNTVFSSLGGFAPPMPMTLVEGTPQKPFFQGIAHLKSGISRGQADASFETLAAALRREYTDANAGHAISVQPVTTALFSTTGGEGGLALVSTVLLLIVGLVLLIACSN